MFQGVFNFTISDVMQKISFYSADRKIPLRNRTAVRQFLSSLFLKENIEVDHIDYIICSDEYLLKINEAYLNHSYYTDIITFCLSSPGAPVLAELYLSTDRIKENAKAYSVTYHSELLRVIIHGALHLCGYQDLTASQKKEMRKRENLYLDLYQKSFT